MIQGTCSDAGKSIITTGLCRIFKQDGYRVAPFKSQNMALNSFVTKDGLEMGRAQAVQAEAAEIEPDVLMNPILLKPTGDAQSQVILKGEVLKNMSAKEYYKAKKSLVPEIEKAYKELDEKFDIIVIEGAGSPAEINLKEQDIVNMFIAKMTDAPVLLTGDIDRGGVFASLYGTLALLDEDEKARVKGLLINKFRGDLAILQPGLETIEELTGVKVAGTIPYLDVDIDKEDSLAIRRKNRREDAPVEIAVIKTPRMSNFTDFNVFEYMDEVSVVYIDNVETLGKPDMIILPDSKNTMEDLLWMRQNGLEAKIKKKANKGIPIFGICGGYQMLGETIADPMHMEYQTSLQEEGDIYEIYEKLGIENFKDLRKLVDETNSIRGMELLPTETFFVGEKRRQRVEGEFEKIDGIFKDLSGMKYEGYEIHMGESLAVGAGQVCAINDFCFRQLTKGGGGGNLGHVYGTYVHGIFDAEGVAETVVKALLLDKGYSQEEVDNMSEGIDMKTYKEQQYEKLAAGLREALDMDYIYEIMGINR